MSISVTCPCSKKLKAQDSAAGRKVKCSACGAIVPVPGVSRFPPPAPNFPILGNFIGWAAILVGCLLFGGGIILTIRISQSEFKPVGLAVFSLPGLLWVVFGGLLLGLRRRFVIPFTIFLVCNLLLGVFFTTQGRSLGGQSDARIFAMIGLGYIFGPLLFQMFHGLLMRDVRRMDAEAKLK